MTTTMIYVRGNYASGTQVTITPSAALKDSSNATILPATPIVISLDSNYDFVYQLPATDDPGNTPEDLTYTITHPNGSQRNFRLSRLTAVVEDTTDPLYGERVKDVGWVSGSTPITRPSRYEFEFYHDAEGKPNGAITATSTLDSGQFMAPFAFAPAAMPVYLNGKIVDPDPRTTGSSASYVQCRTEKSLVHIGVDWVNTGTSTEYTDGLAFGAFDQKMYSTHILSCAHMTIGVGRWEMLVIVPNANPANPSDFVSVGSGTFKTPLLMDNTTTYHADVYVDRFNGEAFVILPAPASDGQMIKKFTHVGFKQDCRFPFVEPFRSDVTKNPKQGLRSFRGTSLTQDGLAAVRAMYEAQGGGGRDKAIAIYGEAASSQEYLIAGTTYPPPEIRTGGIKVTCNVGQSGKVEVLAAAFGFIMQQTNSLDPIYIWHCIATGSDNVPHAKDETITYQFKQQGKLFGRWVFTGLPPGPATFELRHWQYSTGGSTGNNYLQMWNVLSQFVTISAEAVS